MLKHARNIDPLERPKKKAKIQPIPRVVAAKKAKQVQDLTETSPPHRTTSTKGKQKAINPPSVSPKKKKRPTDDINTSLPTSFKVIAGSYEKLLYGLDGTITVDDQSNLLFHLKPIFIFPAHVSCIKSVAASPHGGKWLATGSADEIIKVWDLKRRKEIGGLMHHEGSITHLTFPSRSHLLSASEDGTLCLFRARDWAVLRVLKGHKGRVNSVAVHPSGKVALSVGKDGALRMWDLMRGKGCASTKLGKEGEVVRWSTDGSKFIVQSGSTIDLYSTNMDLLFSIKHPSRIHDVRFCKLVNGEGEVMLVGGEDHKTTVYSIPRDSIRPTIIAEMIGHSNRIKAVQTIGIALPSSSGRTSTIIACTVSSDGNVNLYDIAAIPDQSSADTPQKTKQIEPLTTYDSKGTRLTCVTLADGDMSIDGTVNGKRKRENGEDGNGNGDEDHESDQEELDSGEELEEAENVEGGDEDEHEHRHDRDQEESDSGSDKEELEDEEESDAVAS